MINYMKSIIRILIVLMLTLSFQPFANAQSINGFRIGNEYTYSQFVSSFGIPESYCPYGNGDEKSESYYYDGLYLETQHGGVLYCFSIKSSNYVTLTENIPGGVRCGDQFSKVQPLAAHIKIFETENADNDYITTYHVWFGCDDNSYNITVKNGIITGICYIMLD